MFIWLGCLLQIENYVIRESSFCPPSLILSSSKQPWEVWRCKTKILLQIISKRCNAGMTTHRTSGWDIFVFPFFLTWTSSRPHKCKIYWWTVWKTSHRICTACLCWQPCQPVFLCCIMLVWVRSASDSDPCGSTTDTPFGSSAPVPLHKWASVKIEHVQMAGEPFHISLFATDTIFIFTSVIFTFNYQ